MVAQGGGIADVDGGAAIITTMEHECDVLIVGGGLVGTSLALALAPSGLRVTLIEARAASGALLDPERERYLALSAASVNALRHLGVWSRLESASTTPIRAVHVSRRGDFGRSLLRAQETGRDAFGAVVPASQLGQALALAVSETVGVQRLAPASVVAIESAADAVAAAVELDGEQHRLGTKVLIGADGSDSFVRAQAGLLTQTHDYGQDALVLSVGIGRDHQGIAYERFTDDGAIAALPLSGRRVGMVWTLDRAQAAQMQSLDDAGLLHRLQTAFGQRLGRLHAPGRRFCHPLSRRWATETVRGRIAVIGNAAQTLHPIAAQGFNLGLRDALVLAESLWAHPDDGVEALQIHQRRRRADRERIAALSHALARWPKVSLPGLAGLRSLGFGLLNASSDLRRSLMLAGMGFADDAPAWSLDPAA